MMGLVCVSCIQETCVEQKMIDARTLAYKHRDLNGPNRGNFTRVTSFLTCSMKRK